MNGAAAPVRRGDQISAEECRIYATLLNARGWLTAAEVTMAARVSARTARAHLLAMKTIGLVETLVTAGGYRHRLVARRSEAGQAYVARVEAARAALGEA